MLRLLKPSPLQWVRLLQIGQLPISTGAAATTQTRLSPFTVIVFFSSAASNLPHESPKTNAPVFDFFHSYGFTEPQIKRFISTGKCPSVRSTEKIKPKLEYLLAFGFSPSELIRIICWDPKILTSSLKERIEPNLKLLEATLAYKTLIIKAITRKGSWLVRDNIEKHVIPNFKLLREINIPTATINRLFTTFPTVLTKDPNVITESISKLKGLGMSPSTLAFVYGLCAVATLKKETWEKKMEIYRSFGWSEKDTLSAFSRQPTCLTISEDKIKKQMSFFIEKLRWNSAMVLRWPSVLTCSLEGRIIPRCAVLNVLARNGLWSGKPKASLFCMSENNFKERYVVKYEKKVPQVIDAYQGKLELQGFEIED